MFQAHGPSGQVRWAQNPKLRGVEDGALPGPVHAKRSEELSLYCTDWAPRASQAGASPATADIIQYRGPQ